MKNKAVDRSNAKPQEVKDMGVDEMFDTIARRYDLLNHLLSLGIDHRWKGRVAREITRHVGGANTALANDIARMRVLDVATGTADIAIKLKRGGVGQVVGGDISHGMLEVGRAKLRRIGLHCELMVVDAMAMPFGNAEFDGLSCGFGVRNFTRLDDGLSEFHRVLKPGGVCCTIEYCKGGGRGLWGVLWRFYFKRFLPFVGGLISGDRAAYRYLPDSVDDFCTSVELVERLRSVGFRTVRRRELMGGIVTIFTAVK